MNIFEELAESYTYNGVVSLKAIDDDIVTLENQLDSFKSTLEEIRIRGKKTGPLIEKMRDTKVRLSLLKALYRRESDKNASDDIVLNMLGFSANNAKEVELPKTAAEGKEPVVQNFEESEVEVVEETVEDTDAVVSENEDVEDVVIEENDDVTEMTADNLVREEDDEDLQTTEESSTEPEPETNAVQAEVTESEKEKKAYSLGHETDINDKAGDVVIEQFSTPSHTDYIIPSNEDEQEECPPPTLDDYLEPIDTPEDIFHYDMINNQDFGIPETCDEPVIDESKNVVTYEDNSEMNEVSVELSDSQDIAYDYPAYDAFADEPISEIYSSFDLSPYTDMVNTDTVAGAFDNKRKILEVTFHDIRDYSIFVKLMKQKRPGLFSFLEKPKSIFMDVHERHGDEEKIYHYEFANCRLKYLLDSRYSPKSETVTTETEKHECTAVFKYKKLKLT